MFASPLQPQVRIGSAASLRMARSPAGSARSTLSHRGAGQGPTPAASPLPPTWVAVEPERRDSQVDKRPSVLAADEEVAMVTGGGAPLRKGLTELQVAMSVRFGELEYSSLDDLDTLRSFTERFVYDVRRALREGAIQARHRARSPAPLP